MKEIIIEVPDSFGQELKPEKVNCKITGELVRCNDCRFFDSYNVECTKKHGPRPPYNEWFCADGRKREG